MGGTTTEAIRQKFEPRCAMGEKVVYECWIGDEDTDVTFTGAKQVGAMRARGLIPADATLRYTIEAESWTEAMIEHHKRQGLEPYAPMVEVPPSPTAEAISIARTPTPFKETDR